MSYCFLASPYSHPSDFVRHNRWLEAMDASFWCLKKGIAIYAPIVHWHNVHQRHDTQCDAHFFSRQNIALLDKADFLLILTTDGWRKSDGIMLERAYAKERNIPERFLIRVSEKHLHFVEDGDYRVDDHPPSHAHEEQASTQA